MIHSDLGRCSSRKTWFFMLLHYHFDCQLLQCWTCREGRLHWCIATCLCTYSGNGDCKEVHVVHFHFHRQKGKCNIPVIICNKYSSQKCIEVKELKMGNRSIIEATISLREEDQLFLFPCSVCFSYPTHTPAFYN